ncbi:MAG: IPTL-CTERM sorting domain-containing protein, partial [Acidobacteria bacterium]|nr:IPTL-CTERM sorting domain-containing protein [Acidobacteriota bacterium]
IYVMNADGSQQTRLTNNAAQDVRPSWQAVGAQGIASTPIPTLSEWGIILLALLLTAAGVWCLRKNRSVSAIGRNRPLGS